MKMIINKHQIINRILFCSILFSLLTVGFANAQQLYTMPSGEQSRWTSPENPTGEKGAGAIANNGAKGHAFDTIKAHGYLDLLNIKGAGVVNRIKLTVDNRSPEMMRSLRIEMYWDGATKPAVSAPLGDFFGVGLGQSVAFECALFSNPEGRSYNCIIPMPFKTGARIVIYNDSNKDLHHIFYDVSFERWDKAPDNLLYFHAYWHQNKPKLDSDFYILPNVNGEGRFLGANIAVAANPDYGKIWWGEGEVKMFLDGDQQHPTLVGTGAEDYIGTAWGTGKFINQYQGCLIADTAKSQWAFYRYHIPDPVYFHQNIKVTIQQIGGGPLNDVRKAAANGAEMDLVSVDVNGSFRPLKEIKNPPKLTDKDFPNGWTNFYRRDNWCATAYFYLNKPTDDLPAIAPVEERIENL